MKRLNLFAYLFVCTLLLTGCSVDWNSSLKEISRPYACEYQCKRLLLYGEDVLDSFREVKLSLKPDDTFLLFAEEKDGKVSSYAGSYKLSPEGIELTFSNQKTAIFPYKKGEIFLTLPLKDGFVLAEFSSEA